MSEPPTLSYATASTAADDAGALVLHPPPRAWSLAILALEIVVALAGAWIATLLAVHYLGGVRRDHDLVFGVTAAVPAVACVAWLVRCIVAIVRVKRLGHTACTLRIEGESLVVHWPMEWGPAPRLFPRAEVHSYHVGGLGVRKLFIFSRTRTILTVPFRPAGGSLPLVRQRLREMLGPELD